MNNFIIKKSSHKEILLWIEYNNEYLDKEHKCFENWIKSHGTRFKNSFIKKPYYWTIVKENKKTIGIMFCCISKHNKRFVLYDGYQFILPEYRGLGLGVKLDKYQFDWTLKKFNWSINFTFAEKEYLDYNQKLGFKLLKKTPLIINDKIYFIMVRKSRG